METIFDFDPTSQEIKDFMPSECSTMELYIEFMGEICDAIALEYDSNYRIASLLLSRDDPRAQEYLNKLNGCDRLDIYLTIFCDCN